jgi:NAD(P)-dependent dehydrogenase (short-subunit alcohol dehydrogenase family)
MNRCPHPHAVVTGASSGIGRATALRLARSGYHVFAGVRKPADGAALQEAAQQQAAAELTPLPLDVTSAAQIAGAAEAVTGHTAGAGLDALVNNAGIGLFGPLEIIGIDDFRRQLEVNVTGQLEVTQAFLPLIRAAHGRIVMIGSIGARCTPPFVGALAASKSTLATMTEALRQELAPWGIRVVLVEPASIRTDAAWASSATTPSGCSARPARPAAPCTRTTSAGWSARSPPSTRRAARLRWWLRRWPTH